MDGRREWIMIIVVKGETERAESSEYWATFKNLLLEIRFNEVFHFVYNIIDALCAKHCKWLANGVL